eukprot:1706062-Prymnesium_polylepis.1
MVMTRARAEQEGQKGWGTQVGPLGGMTRRARRKPMGQRRAGRWWAEAAAGRLGVCESDRWRA